MKEELLERIRLELAWCEGSRITIDKCDLRMLLDIIVANDAVIEYLVENNKEVK